MFGKIRKAIGAAGFAALLVAGTSSVGQAGLLDSYLTPNAINFFEDNSREAFFDVNNSGTFNAGDVLVGYLQVETRSAPSSIGVQGTMYAIFSQQVQSISASGIVTFTPTTVAGLTLSTFVPGAEANAYLAIYTRPLGVPDLTAVGSGAGFNNLIDYFNYIKTGATLELTAGIAAGSDAVFQALPNDVDLSTYFLGTRTTSQPVAVFGAVLDILTNNTAFTFEDDLCSSFNTFLGGFNNVCGQLSLVSGNVLGAANVANPEFKTLGAGSFTQCDSDNNTDGIQNTVCGFIDNADFNLHPVPEPASMILFGIGLAGLGIYGRKRSRKSE